MSLVYLFHSYYFQVYLTGTIHINKQKSKCAKGYFVSAIPGLMLSLHPKKDQMLKIDIQ